MRKLLPLLLVLFLPLTAHALPYEESTVLSVQSLTPDQQALVAYLYTPVFNGAEEIPLPENTPYADVAPAMQALMQDYPELFHLGNRYTVGYYQDAPDVATNVRPEYRLDAATAGEIRAELYLRAYLLADANPTAEGLHGALCEAVTYGGDTDMAHTAAGALLEGRATCEGYAHALTLLYRMAGIPCGTVSGTAVDDSGQTEGHSWNIACLADYTLIDATWNDQSQLGLNTNWYFGLSTAQMGRDHFPAEGQSVPLCGGQDNWHARRGLAVATQDTADAALRQLVQEGRVNLRITDENLYRALAQDTHAYLEGYNARNPEWAFYGAYTVVRSDAQGCVAIWREE